MHGSFIAYEFQASVHASQARERAPASLLVMRVVLLLFLFLSRVGVAVQMGSSLESMLDIMAGFSTGHEYDRDFLGRLYSCWDSVNPNVKEVQDRIWQASIRMNRSHIA